MKILALDRSFYKLYRQDLTELSPQAQKRLHLIEGFERLRTKGLSGEEAALILGSSRATIYRWKQRLARCGPRGLELRSRRPQHVRQATWSSELVQRVEQLRRRFPAWGKAPLTILLRREGFATSESTVGRILSQLIQRRRIEPFHRLRRRHRQARHRRRVHAKHLSHRHPKPKTPGERVQVDTLSVAYEAGKQFKHFTATCPVSRWTVGHVYSRATASCAANFLDRLLEQTPFPIQSIQVDGGSEFMAEFETACQDRQIELLVLPPRSPHLNGAVERRQLTWRCEFYEIYDLPTQLERLRPLVQRFQDLYNTYRPHQALQGLTPAEYLQESLPGAPTPASVSYVLN